MKIRYTEDMQRIARIWILSLLLGGFFMLPTQAASETSPTSTWKVGIKSAPPFVIQKNGRWSGLSVELWQGMARQMKQPFEYQVYQDLEHLLAAVEQGELDLVIGAISVTPERETRIDFSHPFMQGGPAIATRKINESILDSLYSLLNLNLLKAISALAGVLFLFGSLVWFFERKQNPEQFGGSALKGLGEGFWWSAVTMTTVGYGDRAPITTGGRVLGIIWMFSGVILISSFTAAITSSLTVEQFKTKIHGFGDLPGLRVESVSGSSSSTYLQGLQIQHKNFETIARALQNLEQGNSDALVYDQAMLKYLIGQQEQTDLIVLPETLLTENYAFALPEGSKNREELNRSLLQEINSNRWQTLLQTYLN